jgi:hypothetical protein
MDGSVGWVGARAAPGGRQIGHDWGRIRATGTDWVTKSLPAGVILPATAPFLSAPRIDAAGEFGDKAAMKRRRVLCICRGIIR